MDSTEFCRKVIKDKDEVSIAFRVFHLIIGMALSDGETLEKEIYQNSVRMMGLLMILAESYHQLRSNGEMEFPIESLSSESEVKTLRSLLGDLYEEFGIADLDKEKGDYDDKRFK